MSTQIDLDIMELLASKICHDLISPIGAINNGMELIEELGAENVDEIFDLIGFSAAQASAKLQAYRMAYGAGGADASIKPEDVHTSIEAIIAAEKKIVQDWDPHGPLGYAERPEAYCKMLISCILLAMEALPKGGTIKVEAGEGEQTIIRAEGPDAGLRGGMDEALALNIPGEQLEPKHMHAYVCGLTAKNYNYELTLAQAGDGFTVFALNMNT